MHAPLHLTALLGLVASSARLGDAANPTRGLRQRRSAAADEAHESSANAPPGASSSPSDREAEFQSSEEPPWNPPRPQRAESLVALQFTPDPHAGKDGLRMVLDGEAHLAAIRYSPSSFDSADAGGFGGIGGGAGGYYADDVHGEFCVYDPSSNKLADSPSDLPTAHSVMGTSDHCGEHRYRLPLREVVEAVKERDSGASTSWKGIVGGGSSKGGDDEKRMKQLPLSGMIFHEGHSGAGLISNVLTGAFDSSLVISEHPALADALAACDTLANRHRAAFFDCSPAAHARLIQDVITLLSRTREDSKVDKLYLKLSSLSSSYLPDLRALYPDAPWVFAYRDAESVLAKATSSKARRGACAGTRRNPPKVLRDKSEEANVDLEALTRHEVCALHLSSLLDAASKEHESSGTGVMVSYDDDLLSSSASDILVEVVLPYLGLQEEVDSLTKEEARYRVSGILMTRSNTSRVAPGASAAWTGEETEITNKSREVASASRAYMAESTDGIGRFVDTRVVEVKARG